jgi:uncharacterized protein YjbJ (UPF0337 family)
MDRQMQELRQELRGDMQELRGDMDHQMQELRGDMQELRGDMQELRGDMQELRGDIATEFRYVGQQFEELRGELADVVRRQAIILPLPSALTGRVFVPWGKGETRFVREPKRIHAFDCQTDCDYGLA